MGMAGASLGREWTELMRDREALRAAALADQAVLEAQERRLLRAVGAT